MKTAVAYRKDFATPKQIPYPNAVSGRLLHKVLDTLLVAAMGAGCAAVLLLALALI